MTLLGEAAATFDLKVLGMIGLAGVGMATALGTLWRMVTMLTRKLVTLSEEVGELRGRQQGVEQFGKDVLKTVHQVAKQAYENRS